MRIKKVEIYDKSNTSKYSHDDNGIQCTGSDFEDQSINGIGVSLHQKLMSSKESKKAIKNIYDIDYPYGKGMMGEKIVKNRLARRSIQGIQVNKPKGGTDTLTQSKNSLHNTELGKLNTFSQIMINIKQRKVPESEAYYNQPKYKNRHKNKDCS